MPDTRFRRAGWIVPFFLWMSALAYLFHSKVCISLLVFFFLECLWSLFSKVCLTHFWDSLASFFSVSHFLFCSWEWSSLPVCVCVPAACSVLISYPAHLSFVLSVNWLFVTLSPCLFDILPFSDPAVSTPSWLSLSTCPFCLSWAIFSLFPALGASMSLCSLFLPFCQSSLFSLVSSLLFPFCWLLGLLASSWVCVFPSLMSCSLLSLHIFCACVCSCLHICCVCGLLSPF